MSNLKNQLIKIGNQNPELRKHLKPVLDYLPQKHRKEARCVRCGRCKESAGALGPGKSKSYPIAPGETTEKQERAQKALRERRWPDKVEQWLEYVADWDLPMMDTFKNEAAKQHPKAYDEALKMIDPKTWELKQRLS